VNHAWLCLPVCVAALLAAGLVPSRGEPELASVSLTCAPAKRGAQCRLLALFGDVTRPPRDVTAEASWRVSGVAGAHISPLGIVDAPNAGDVTIETRFETRRARVSVRLVPGQPGQLLATLRGTVYIDTLSGLCPLAHARVALVGGPSAGISTTADDDGTFEFTGVVPGEVTVRASGTGFESGKSSTEVMPGENHLSVFMKRLIRTAELTL
jgi:hypothetical protein